MHMYRQMMVDYSIYTASCETADIAVWYAEAL